MQAIGCSRQEGGFSYVRQVEHDHEHAREAKSEPAMRIASVFNPFSFACDSKMAGRCSRCAPVVISRPFQRRSKLLVNSGKDRCDFKHSV